MRTARDLPRLTYTIPEVAQLLGVSKDVAYDMARDGRLPTVPAGRRRIVPKAAFERLLADPARVAS